MKRSNTILFFIGVFIPLMVGLITVFTSCEGKSKPDSNIHYINMDCIIVEKISSVESGRHTSKAFLIRSVKDTTLYSEYLDLYRYTMPDSVYYSNEVGDTLHFDYIRKNRFFKK
jgi:hypothetical protein